MYLKCDCDVNAISQHVTLQYLSINNTNKTGLLVTNRTSYRHKASNQIFQIIIRCCRFFFIYIMKLRCLDRNDVSAPQRQIQRFILLF